MNAKAWAAAGKVRTLAEAHDALVALRPFPEADRSVWIAYYQRSAAVYRHVAEADPAHKEHATYWAERERSNTERLTRQADNPNSGAASRRRNGHRTKSAAASGPPAEIPATLEEAHELLRKAQPGRDATQGAWLAYHWHAVEVYAEVAEVDRAHHYEALFFATFAQRKTILFRGSDEDVPTDYLDR